MASLRHPGANAPLPVCGADVRGIGEVSAGGIVSVGDRTLRRGFLVLMAAAAGLAVLGAHGEAALAGIAHAASSSIRIVVNGQAVPLQPEPVLRNGRLLAPFKEILPSLQLFGSMAQGQLRTSPRKGRFPIVTLHLWGQKAWIVPGMRDCRETRSDVAPSVVDGHAMVPLRFLAEAMGVPVRWDRTTTTAFLQVDPNVPRAPLHLPKSVPPVTVSGTWTVKYGQPLVCATCESPFSVTLPSIAPAQPGAPVEVAVTVWNNSGRTIALDEPATVRVRIARDFGCPVIWEGVLPPLRSGEVSWGMVELRFAWARRDAYRRPVPPGDYVAEIAMPLTLRYTKDGSAAEERLTDTSHSAISGEFDLVGFTIR